MNGGADLGGMMGFGPVIEETDEPLFHAEWEARMLGMVVALGACGQWNIDMSRFSRESLAPGEYLTSSYYEIWMKAAVRLMIERGMISESEIAAGSLIEPPVSVSRKLEAGDVQAVLNAGSPVDRPADRGPKFKISDSVRTINDHPGTHTRLPRYARDKTGIITKIHGFHVYPDSNAHDQGEDPQWLYKVSFPARTLWGSSANEIDRVSLDLWEPYLRCQE